MELENTTSFPLHNTDHLKQKKSNDPKDFSYDELDSELKSFHYWSISWTILDTLGLIITLLLQGSALNYFIVYYNNGDSGWYFFFLGDFLILILFIFAIIYSKRYYSVSSNDNDNNSFKRFGKTFFNVKFPNRLGALPMIYISWFIYGLFLMIKIFILFITNVPQKMIDIDLLRGPETLELCLGASSIVFLLWVEVHKNIDEKSNKKLLRSVTNDLIGHTVFELFDSVFFLDLIIPDQKTPNSDPQETISSALKYTIITLASLNFLYPSLSLFRYSKFKSLDGPSQNRSFLLGLSVFTYLIRLLLVNIPYLFIRVHLSSIYNKGLTLFILKNVLGMIISLRSLTLEFNQWRQSLKYSRSNNPKIKIDQPGKDGDISI